VTFDAGVGTARDVSRDANGNVKFSQEGTDSITGVTATGVTNTASVTGATGRVNFDRVQASINTGTADLSLLRDGSVLTNVTGFTSGDILESAGTPNKSSPDWSVKANFTQPLTPSVVLTSDGFAADGTPGTPGVSTTLNTTGVFSTVSLQGKFEWFTQNSASFRISLNGNSLTNYTIQTTPSGTNVLSTTVTGTYTDPTATFYALNVSEPVLVGGAYIRTRTATFKSSKTATVNLTASRNQVTTVS